MRHLNPMLPVLSAIAPEITWPYTLREQDVRTLREHTAHLIDETRALAVEAVNNLAATGQLVEPHMLVDVRMMQWAGEAGQHALTIARTATVGTSHRDDRAVFHATMAAMMLRGAEFDLGKSDQRHSKSVLNRALACAEWVGASLATAPTSPTAAAETVRSLLLPGWRWERHPVINEDGTWYFTVGKIPAASSTAPVQLLTIGGTSGQPCHASTRALGQAGDSIEMTWFEACQYLGGARTIPMD